MKDIIPNNLSDRFEFTTVKKSGPQCEEELNPTVPLVLDKIVYDHACEDCTKDLDSCRVVHHKKLVTPYVHWSHQCKTCSMFKCLLSGEYKLTNTEFRNQHREVRGMKPLSDSASQRYIKKLGAITGRPTGSKNKPKVEKEPGRIGRPPGSKNKIV